MGVSEKSGQTQTEERKLNVTIVSLVTTETVHWRNWREKQSFQKIRSGWSAIRAKHVI